jgi:hypothetical protein
MDSIQIIQKLLKIAENQQRIITKLAQQAGMAPTPAAVAPQPTGWQNVTQSVAAILASLPSGKGARVQDAQFSNNSGVHVKIQVRDLSSTADADLRAALAGKALQTADGKTVQAPDASQINVISQMG